MDISFLDTIYILSRKENEKVGASTRCISLIVAGTNSSTRKEGYRKLYSESEIVFSLFEICP